MLGAVQLLNTFCTETEGSYAEFIQPTAQALLPFLDKAESEMMGLLLDEVRAEVFKTWGMLIKAAKIGAQERGAPNSVAPELLQTFLGKLFIGLDQENDPEFLSTGAEGIAECIKNAGSGQLIQEQVQA